MPVLTRILAVMALAATLLAPGLAQAKWLRAESPRFIIYSEGSERQLRDYITKMEVFDTFLRARHGLPEAGVPLRKLPMYLVDSRDDLRLTWHKAGETVAGYYHGGPADTFAIATLEGSTRDDWFNIVGHEYAHHFMLQNFPGAYPAWMVEGYAEYYGTTVIDGKTIEIGRPNQMRSYELTDADWMLTANLLANKRDGKGGGSGNFYAQAWLLTHYLMSDPNRYKQFQAYATAVGKGGDPVTSMEAATGMSAAALDAALKKYKSSALSYIRLNRTDLSVPPITVTEMPASADLFLLERLQLISHSFKDTNAGHVEMLRRRYASYQSDELATLTLAQAELELGDMAKGRQMLLDWIKVHPQDVEARFVLGHFLIWKSRETEDKAEADRMMAEAGELLATAAQIAPKDYRVLYAYAQTRRGEPGFPTVETQTLLITAYRQAPQVVPVRFELIQVLMARRNWPQAEALLQPLVNHPHGGDTAAKAKELLERVKAARAAGS